VVGGRDVERLGSGHIDQVDPVAADAQALRDELGHPARLAFGVA
jgi:hypothetical protein